MSGPVEFSRQIMAADRLLQATPTWHGLMEDFKPAMPADNFNPGDDTKKVLAAFFNTVEGRKIIEWLADLTIRAPYPSTGTSFEQAALAAAKHEARVGVGRAIMKAIADGTDLLGAKRNQSHEKPA